MLLAASWMDLESQGQRLQGKLDLLTPLSWISGLQNCEKLMLCCLTTQSCILL